MEHEAIERPEHPARGIHPHASQTPEDHFYALSVACRYRQQLMNAQLRNGNQLAALERWASGKMLGKRKEVMTERDRFRGELVAHRFAPVMAPIQAEVARERKRVEKEIVALAAQLPVASWIATVRGVGLLALGTLIGSTGDLAGYSCPSKVWKRMGVACINGERQRLVANDPEKAIQHGYNPRRHAQAYVVSECLLKQNDGSYRALYDARKALELEKLPEKKGQKGHAHHRAMRYMVKRFLRDLWCVWNGHELESPASRAVVLAAHSASSRAEDGTS